MPPLEGMNVNDSTDGRQEQRVRQIAISSAVQAAALSQTIRASRGKTSHSGQDGYRPGDMVDYYRLPDDKDTSGWKGPVKVVRNAPDQGCVICNLNGKILPCRYQDVRHTIHIVFLTKSSDKARWGIQLHIVIEHVESLPKNSQQLIGSVHDSQIGKWVITKALQANRRLSAAIQWVASNVFHLMNVVAVRMAHSVSTLSRLTGAATDCEVTLYAWTPGNFESATIESHPNSNIRLRNGSEEICYLQVFSMPTAPSLEDAINDHSHAIPMAPAQEQDTGWAPEMPPIPEEHESEQESETDEEAGGKSARPRI